MDNALIEAIIDLVFLTDRGELAMVSSHPLHGVHGDVNLMTCPQGGDEDVTVNGANIRIFILETKCGWSGYLYLKQLNLMNE